MLSGLWKEAQCTYDDGFRHIELTDFDPHELSVLLHIIHLRHRQVPMSL